MTSTHEVDVAAHAEALCKIIERLLHGRGPVVQGAVLVDLTAMYFAGHHPAVREECITEFVKAMRELIPVNEAIIFEREGGKPAGWEIQ
ncbi:hypothetical protein [Bradyrhizobium sp. BRP23]|uniref:hypothetical protein n=1 Tax=Bradyrhizobium sp. BRP23 TaxID=2793820 RepID=UPI001CD5784D|nr:hypothetical protein [Bradyrhizobium sp. BRP23]MCA1419512.1 hypothetical protein [Bradyrhizobium sp. BRP23]